MSTLLVQSGTFDDIADAIRAKTGKVASMTPLEMPQEIASISGGGGSGVTILSGTTEPTSSQGTDGQIYLKYGNYIYKSFYNGTIIIRENTDDSTDVKAFIVGFVKSSTNYFVIEDSDLLAYLSDITSGKFKGCDAYSSPTAPSFVNYNAFIFIYNNGDVCINTTNASVSGRVTGTFYGMVDLGQAPVTNATNYQRNGNQSCDTTIDKVILSAFLKVNGSWQDLINSDIDDVNLGN